MDRMGGREAWRSAGTLRDMQSNFAQGRRVSLEILIIAAVY